MSVSRPRPRNSAAGDWFGRECSAEREGREGRGGEDSRLDLGKRSVYAGVMTTNGLPAIHPGIFLQEILEELELSQAAFARATGVSSMRISRVTRGTRPVTAELALRFGRALEQSPRYWLNLQADYDLKLAERRVAKGITSIDVVTSRAAGTGSRHPSGTPTQAVGLG